MKRSSRSTLLCLCFAIAGLATSAVHATDYIYNYQTPLLSVTTGVQIGHSVGISSTQNSINNVFSVTQIGQMLGASVSQYGVRNRANVLQITPPLSPFINY